jgi:hypothetical protein
MQTISRFNFDFFITNQSYFVLFVILLRLIPTTADFSYFIVAGFALFGRKQVIVSLVLMWLFSMLNTEIIPYAKYESFSRYIVVLTCLFSILLKLKFKKINNFILITFLFGIFLIIHSILFSNFPIVSILKATYWTLITIILLLAWLGTSRLEHEHTIRWLTEFLFSTLLISFILFLVYPDIGFIVNSSYFHGVFNNPQALGLTAAGVFSLLISQLDFRCKPKLILLIKIMISIFLLLLSGSRTGGIALFMSCLISGLLFFIYKFHSLKLIKKFRIDFIYALLSFVLIMLLLLFLDEISDFIQIYLSKSFVNGSDNGLIFILQSSREILYGPMINNIFQNFFTGIGFGLASDLSHMNVKYFFGIPVSAPIEKGILPISILEEIGIYGFIFFMIWILITIFYTINKGLGSLIVLLTFLSFNLGEAGLFSPNGFGMLYLIVITSVITKPKLIKNIN